MPVPGIRTLGRSLQFWQRAQAVTTNNLANVDTHGFKARRISAFLDAATASPTSVESLDARDGGLEATGRDLDVALQGDGWFLLESPAGLALSRNGHMQIGPEGLLSDGAGGVYLGEDGPIVIPAELRQSAIRINVDGEISAGDQIVGRLRIVSGPVDPANALNAGRFLADAAALQASNAIVIQGSLEASGYDSIQGMAELIDQQRQFNVAASLLGAMDEVASSVVNRISRV